MPLLDQQLHGYRHGHQLLSASVKLPKADQDLVDRLSDVAGPVQSRDHFEPYLTCYPLLSGSHYVLARTWQDSGAPRAGCVRTRSLIVPMSEWMASGDIVGLVDELSSHGPTAPAERVQIDQLPRPLPVVEASQGVELVEALFLEDRKPIAVFDAPDPEGVTLRLLAAFWPSFRRTFAVSTFALSPRTIGGRSFDLVFAPKDARPRFSRWQGRRIDARKPSSGRHRWSREIVDRVFGADRPSLIRDDALGELSSESSGNEAELRISLLWNELHDKLEVSPNAALGLLDIANSRPTRNVDAIRRLEPELARAAQRAAASLPATEAWRFLLAMTDKLRDVRLQPPFENAIRTAALELASRAPADAVANIEMLASGPGRELLIGAVGDGVAQNFDTDRAAAVVELEAGNLLQLLLLSPALADASLPRYPAFSTKLATALAEAPQETRDDAKRHLLRLLVDDHQADAARLFIAELSRDELLAEAKLLAQANGLRAESLHAPLVERARAIEAVTALRDLIAGLPADRGLDALLLRLISPDREDFQWLLDAPTLLEERRLDLVRTVLHSAARGQLKAMVAGRQFEATIQLLMRDPAGNLDIIERVLEEVKPDPALAIEVTLLLLPYADENRARHLASRALEILLPRSTGGNRDVTLDRLLVAMGSSLDGSRAIRAGLARDVPSNIFAANLAAFNRSQPAVRERIMAAVQDVARAIVARGSIDYSEDAVTDAADLLWDSAHLDPQAFVWASATLMPFLLRARREPASPLIAAAFPPVYRELSKAADAPDFLRFFFFVDWDKCKIARHELVDALMRSSWRSTDIALAAARAGDLRRILRRIAKQEGGTRVIADIERNISVIPSPWGDEVQEALKHLRGDSIPDPLDS